MVFLLGKLVHMPLGQGTLNFQSDLRARMMKPNLDSNPDSATCLFSFFYIKQVT